MTMLAATDLTYTINNIKRSGKIKLVEATIAFGDGSLTYKTGGVDITPAKLGFIRQINWLKVIESNGDALHYEYDVSALKLRIFTEARVEYTADSTAVAACSLRVLAEGF